MLVLAGSSGTSTKAPKESVVASMKRSVIHTALGLSGPDQE